MALIAISRLKSAAIHRLVLQLHQRLVNINVLTKRENAVSIGFTSLLLEEYDS